ncbi:hypothetical protein [Pseudomonas fluorescens]|uniref:hypothetical protein n=1 Tax=Pseudomonas fluorescens TaxID=294 RepID=UPI0009358ECB|nr:hypothetical protein [Pseudomonas fluorescens]
MPCEICQDLSTHFVGEDELVWLDFGIEIISVPTAGPCLEEQCLYRFFYESGLVWKVDHIDHLGQPWLGVQHRAYSYESLTPLPGSFRQVPGEPYPVRRAKGLPGAGTNLKK